MAFVDYYKILGVDKNIPQKDVRSAYKKRAKQFHPDLHPNDPKAKVKFQALNEAYDVLSDPDKRAKYDRYGENWKNADAFGGGFGGSGGGNPFGGFDFSSFKGGRGGFSDFFNDLFGGGSRRSNPFGGDFGGNSQPVDTGEVNASCDIDMYTALLGGEVVISTPAGKNLKLKLKPGTQPGSKVRLRGKGRLGSNGTYGDIILTINVNLPSSLNARQQELLREMQRS